MKSILIYGLKNSGVSLINTLSDNTLYVYDDNIKVLNDVCNKFNNVICCNNPYDIMDKISLMVISPGISIFNDVVRCECSDVEC